ncbi:MAG: glycosyltransferase [Gammaproteobacteria bacterium]
MTSVMINYSGWQADLLRDSGAGIVVPPNDPGQAAAILVEFLANPAAVGSAGLAAQRLAAEQFDVDRLAARFVRVLEKAVGTG